MAGDNPGGVVYSWEEDETNAKKFARKFKESPLVPLGMAGLFGTVFVGLWNIKRRGIHAKKIPLSLQLIHIRVGAQSMVVGAIMVGVTYNLATRYWTKKSET